MVGTPCRMLMPGWRSARHTSSVSKRLRTTRLAPACCVASSTVAMPKMCDSGSAA